MVVVERGRGDVRISGETERVRQERTGGAGNGVGQANPLRSKAT
jgi:hypothetical protein